MSTPFKKKEKKLGHPWSGPVSAPKGHNFTKWEGTDGQRCETIAEAEDYKTRAVRVLENSETAPAAYLSLTFQKCWEEDPCEHQLEPTCARRLRINFVGRASKAITDHCADELLSSVTLVFEKGKFAPGQLHKASMNEIVLHVRRMFKKARLSHLKVIGAVDISYNENSLKTWGPHWQLHVHCVVAGIKEAKLKERLKKVFPQSKTIKKPVEVKAVYDLMGSLSYCCKSYFERRVSYINRKGHWDSRDSLPLKPEQFREAALFMATQKVSSRFLFQGFRRRGRYLEATS